MEVTAATFPEAVLACCAPVLVDFWASWCPPCKMMEPVLARLAAEYDGRAQVAKVNIDRNAQLAAQYGIQGVPTFVVFRGGQPQGRLTGAQTLGKLRALVDAAL